MEEKKKEGYIAGIVGIFLTGILVIFGLETGFVNTSGQVYLLLIIVFGSLSIGSIKWPETVGAILAQIFKNVGEKLRENSNNSFQNQSLNSQSGDINGHNVNVNAKDSNTPIYIGSNIGPESNQGNKEMDLVVAPLYANSRPDRKNLYFMKGAPGYYGSANKKDKNYFDFWDKIKYNQHYCKKGLRNALDNYYANQTNIIGDVSDDKYFIADLLLIEKIEERYGELLDK